MASTGGEFRTVQNKQLVIVYEKTFSVWMHDSLMCNTLHLLIIIKTVV